MGEGVQNGRPKRDKQVWGKDKWEEVSVGYVPRVGDEDRENPQHKFTYEESQEIFKQKVDTATRYASQRVNAGANVVLTGMNHNKKYTQAVRELDRTYGLNGIETSVWLDGSTERGGARLSGFFMSKTLELKPAELHEALLARPSRE